MSGNNTTSDAANRDAITVSDWWIPDLWIPYVLIGVSCVTFLAVHFWCYHKRNRARYLRKRDEKRVKSGLLERRRITTLMLARYQSDLGVSHRERDIDLTTLFYDNSVDVVCDEFFDYNSTSANNIQGFNCYKVETKDKMPILRAQTDTSHQEKSLSPLKTITNSQTWPLVTERTTVPYNAHKGCDKDGKAIGLNENTNIAFDVESSDLCIDDGVSTSKDQVQMSVAVDVLMPHDKSNMDAQDENNSQKISAAISEHSKSNVSRAGALKSSSSPTSYPSVLYTSLNSPDSSQSYLYSTFKPKHKRRRYEGSSKKENDKDNYETSDDMTNKLEELDRLYDKEATCLNKCSFYNTNNSDCYTLACNEQFCSSHKKLDRSPRGSSESEVLPFAEGELAYGSISNNSECEMIPMMQLNDVGNKNFDQSLERNALQGCSNESHENPVCDLSSYEKVNSKTCTNMDFQTADSKFETIPHSQNCCRQHNIVIPFTEKSRLNIVSRNPGKIRTATHRKDSTQPCLSKQRPGLLNKRNTFDNHNGISKYQVPQSCNCNFNTDTETTCVSYTPGALTCVSHTPGALTCVSHTPGTPTNTQFKTSALFSVTDKQGKIQSSFNFVDESHMQLSNDHNTTRNTLCNNALNITPDISSKAPRLRDLNKSLAFHNTKRKLELKSD